VDVMPLNRKLDDLDKKSLRVSINDPHRHGKAFMMAKTRPVRFTVHFKNDMKRIFCRKWPFPSARALSSQFSTVLILKPARFEK
jgi:hypothetical protein